MAKVLTERLALPNLVKMAAEPEFVAAGEYKVSITYGDHKGQTTITVLPAPGSELK